MAQVNCSACDELRNDAPGFVLNGLDKTMCTSLQNDTGLVPANGNDDCEDLNNMNDCLIGNEEAEVDAYEVCDWKDFAKKHLRNLYNMLKAIICAVCGLWTNVHNLWEKVNCLITLATGEKSITLNNPTPGTGVEIRNTSSSGVTSADVDVIIGAGCYRVQGSLKIYLDGTSKGLDMSNYWGSMGIDKRVKPRSENGYLVPRGTPDSSGYNSGHRNSYFITNVGNWTLVTFLIKKSDVPWVKHFYYGVGGFQDIGNGNVTAQWADGDASSNTLSGQWGSDSTPMTVPAGYFGVKVGLSSVVSWDGYTTEESTGRTICNCTFNVMGMYKGSSAEFSC